MPSEGSDVTTLRILAICGSLRTASWTRMVLAALDELAPRQFAIRIRTLEDIPMFNQDDLDAHGYPPPVQAFRREVSEADGIIIGTPEYNHSIPGVLKNAFDWMAGKPTHVDAKPVAVISVAPNARGAAFAAGEMRRVLQGMGAHTLSMPEVFVNLVPQRFDESGRLTDESVREALHVLLSTFRDWIVRLRDPAVVEVSR